jgi:SNF2 family DNA or RNA helicase
VHTSPFIHPDVIGSTSYQPETVMSSTNADEALRNFFEAALLPEADEEEDQSETPNEDAGRVEGLKVILMEHQIEGLKFLQQHESGEHSTDKKKSKPAYGGILADDVRHFN